MEIGHFSRRKYLEAEHWIPAHTLGTTITHEQPRTLTADQLTSLSPNRRSATIMQWVELGATVIFNDTEPSQTEEVHQNAPVNPPPRVSGTRFTHLLTQHFNVAPHMILTHTVRPNRLTPPVDREGNCEPWSSDEPPLPAAHIHQLGARREMGTRYGRLFAEHFAFANAPAASEENPSPRPAAGNAAAAADGNPSLIASAAAAEETAAGLIRLSEQVSCFRLDVIPPSLPRPSSSLTPFLPVPLPVPLPASHPLPLCFLTRASFVRMRAPHLLQSASFAQPAAAVGPCNEIDWNQFDQLV